MYSDGAILNFFENSRRYLRMNVFITGVNDTGKKCIANCSFCNTISGRRSQPMPPILSLEPPWKGAKAPHTPWRPLLLQTKMALFSFGGLRGLWSRCVGCLCIYVFITSVNNTGEQLSLVTTTPAINLLLVTRTRIPWRRGATKDRRKLKGTSYRRCRIFPQCHWYQSEITKNLKFIACVNNTLEKLFTGVNNTAHKFFSSVNNTGD